MLLSETLAVVLDSDSARSGYRIWTRRYLYLIRTMTGKACMCLANQRPEQEESDEVGLGDPATGKSTGPREAAAALSFFDNARRSAS